VRKGKGTESGGRGWAIETRKTIRARKTMGVCVVGWPKGMRRLVRITQGGGEEHPPIGGISRVRDRPVHVRYLEFD
jgi:hypothetical protein